jgi:hypothetical protein
MLKQHRSTKAAKSSVKNFRYLLFSKCKSYLYTSKSEFFVGGLQVPKHNKVFNYPPPEKNLNISNWL